MKKYNINDKALSDELSDELNIFLTLYTSDRYLIFKNKSIHRLIAETFIPNPENKPYVNHINSNRLDNRIENLEWVSQEEYCAAHPSHPRKVIQINMNDNVINKYDSLKEAGTSIGFSESAISKAVLEINNTAERYVWEYKDTRKNEVTI
jgi:hypothetical protein